MTRIRPLSALPTLALALSVLLSGYLSPDPKARLKAGSESESESESELGRISPRKIPPPRGLRWAPRTFLILSRSPRQKHREHNTKWTKKWRVETTRGDLGGVRVVGP